MPRIEIAAKRAQTGGPIVAAAAVNPSAAAPGFATQFCDVEVDPDTGNPNLPKGAAMSRNTSVIPSVSLMLSTMPGAGVHAEGGGRTRAQASVAEADAISSPCGIKERTTKLYRRRGRLSFGGKASFACPLILDL